MTTTENIPHDRIRTDGGTQPRAAIHVETCREYAEAMESGEQFPAVEVYFDGQHYWLADGFHRLFAHRKARPDDPIECVVYQGTLQDAQWHSYGVNKAHGLRRSARDKERAIKAALTHPKGPTQSDRQIAAHVGVSPSTVAKYRAQLESTVQIGQSTARTGRDGRTINTANIGKSTSKRKGRRDEGVKISPKARMPKLGHSPPNPMIPVQFSPNNARTAAATLIREFSRQWVEALVQELTRFLSSEGGTLS